MKRFLIALVLSILMLSAAVAEDSPWTLRFHGAIVESSVEQSATAATGGVSSRVDVGAGGGIGLGAEYRLSDKIGLEFSTLLAGVAIDTTFAAGGSGLYESLELSMVPLTLGVPFHFGVGSRTDIYLGPTLSYVSYVDTSYSVSYQSAQSVVDVDSDTAFGAAVGLDAGFGDGGWAFSTGLRYMKTAAGETDIDPLIVTLGFAYRFQKKG